MMMESGAAFSNPSSGKIDQQRKILEVGGQHLFRNSVLF